MSTQSFRETTSTRLSATPFPQQIIAVSTGFYSRIFSAIFYHFSNLTADFTAILSVKQ
jgi:hypothetical protein